MQNFRDTVSNLTRKWWCMGHNAIKNRKKAIQKMKAHAGSETHLRHAEAELLPKRGTVVQQLQHIGDLEKSKNRKVISSLHSFSMQTAHSSHNKLQ